MRRLAAVLVVLGLGLSASAAASPVHPTFPTCGAFSTARVSRLVGVGRLYLVNAIAHRTSCTYYGVPATQATKLATKGVSYKQIRYYPSLLIAVTPASSFLFGVQRRLIEQTAQRQHLEFAAVSRSLRFTREEDFYSGQVGGGDEPRCNPQLQYDNWVGPPDCDGEPALKKVGVIAYIPTGGHNGRLVSITATEQAPGVLSLSHVLELARQTVNGQLY
jgi:hypothetical protein